MPGIFIWPGVALGCVDDVCAGIFMPGMFISIFSGEAAGFRVVDEDGDGELAGISIPGMFIFSGDKEGFADGEAVAEGICIPGIFICSGEALGRADGACAGIPCMPGISMSIFWAGVFFEREDARDEEGMFMPFILVALIPPLFCVCFLLAAVDLDLDLGLFLGLLPMFMPGMFCMSCCAETGAAATTSRKAAAIAQNLKRKINLKLFMIPSRMIPVSGKLRLNRLPLSARFKTWSGL